jgi:Rrf2 family protein
MILSRSGEYALLALLHLADRSDATPVRGGDIARALDAPANYLSKLLHQLARAGVLDSTRGPQGGFALAIPPEELSLAKALATIEADRLDARCLLRRAECRDDDPCAAHERWCSLSDRISRFLEETTLANLLQDEARARQYPLTTRRQSRRHR